MVKMKWEEGKSGGGYLKHCFFETKWLDCVLIKFPDGAKIDPHLDACDYGDHYRINIELIVPKLGGNFGCDGGPILRFSRFILFRPDIQKHWVTEVKGEKLTLSVGWTLPCKQGK